MQCVDACQRELSTGRSETSGLLSSVVGMYAATRHRARVLLLAVLVAGLLTGCVGADPRLAPDEGSASTERASEGRGTEDQVADGEGHQSPSSTLTPPAASDKRSGRAGPSDVPPGEPGGLIINPTPKPPPPPPEPPEAMSQESDRGAVAAAGHYLRLMTYAFVTGEIGPMAEMSSSQCTGCDTLMRNIETIQDNGGRVVWPELSLQHVAVEAPTSDDGLYVLTFDRHNAAVLYLPGRPGGTPLPQVYSDEVLSLRYDDGAWRVIEFDVGEPDPSV